MGELPLTIRYILICSSRKRCIGKRRKDDQYPAHAALMPRQYSISPSFSSVTINDSFWTHDHELGCLWQARPTLKFHWWVGHLPLDEEPCDRLPKMALINSVTQCGHWSYLMYLTFDCVLGHKCQTSQVASLWSPSYSYCFSFSHMDKNVRATDFQLFWCFCFQAKLQTDTFICFTA